jgi:uncharacterized protein (DUF952 family)
LVITNHQSPITSYHLEALLILHITSKQEWLEAQQRGEYVAPSLQTEGFIHCSTDKQVVHVANAFYHGQGNLVLLVIDESKLTSELKWEPPAGPPAAGISVTDTFPHIYGAINLDAVVSVTDFKPDPATGKFSLPANL